MGDWRLLNPAAVTSRPDANVRLVMTVGARGARAKTAVSAEPTRDQSRV